jgi:hypothetical protein
MYEANRYLQPLGMIWLGATPKNKGSSREKPGNDPSFSKMKANGQTNFIV